MLVEPARRSLTAHNGAPQAEDANYIIVINAAMSRQITHSGLNTNIPPARYTMRNGQFSTLVEGLGIVTDIAIGMLLRLFNVLSDECHL